MKTFEEQIILKKLEGRLKMQKQLLFDMEKRVMSSVEKYNKDSNNKELEVVVRLNTAAMNEKKIEIKELNNIISLIE